MKLWQKTSLICIVVLTAVVLLCSSVFLLYTKNSMLFLTCEQTAARQKNLANSFKEMADYYLQDSDSAAMKYTLTTYCFSRFADDSSVLMKDGEILYSGVTIDPSEFLDVQQLPKRVATEIGGRNILISGSAVTLKDGTYSVYVVDDISSVYQSVSRTFWMFTLVSIAGVLLGAFLIALSVRRSTKPLSVLAGAAKEIADGGYQMRANVLTKDEVGALAGDFNRMAEAVERQITDLTETNERQRLFISGVTHEFKTPLTALLLHSQMLRRANLSDRQKDKSLEHIENQCAWLERLVQALLKLFIKRQGIEKEEVAVGALFERVRETTAALLLQRSVKLVMRHSGETLLCNAELMQDLLVNLVDNAAKAYDESSEVRTVILSCTQKTICVEDRGSGIPQEALPHLFEPFYMADPSRSKKNGGSGLGLAVVKAIADAHEARISIQSEVGRGTQVSLEFP